MHAIGTAKKTLKAGSFRTWLDAKPYWERYLWRLHLEKDAVSEVDISQCYQYLLEDSGVVKQKPGRTPIVFPALDLDDTDTPGTKSTLDKIENLASVNAIDAGCVLEFGKNLTIIYGDNGAGKSGIGRLLSNACSSRKPRKLLPNARKTSNPTPRPSADFYVTDTTGPHCIKYRLGEVHQALKSFTVFDHECALIHLDSENKVEFVPSKIAVFDEVFKSISAIEAKLQSEIDAREYEDPTEGLFSGTSPVARFLSSLFHKTTDGDIDSALSFTATDKAELATKKKDVANKLKQDVAVQKKLLQDESGDLITFQNALAIKIAVLTPAKVTQINGVLREISEKREIVDKLSAKNFEFAAFKNVGSPEWKALILAAHRLHEKETASAGGKEPEYCLLCRRALTVKEKTLFGEYWKFLKSTAETELATARANLGSHLVSLERANTSWPAFSVAEVAVKILKRDAPSDLNKIRDGFDRLNAQVLEWIGNIKVENSVQYTDPKIDLSRIAALIAEKKKVERSLIDPTGQIDKLNTEIDYLKQKQQASHLITKVKKHVAWLRWYNVVGGINMVAARSATTRKKTDIMGEIVISQYVNIFNKETERLDCDFGLKVESHGRDANTIKELKLEFARGQHPSDILSEGEQTVSALADFLTEAQLNKNNSGIIFDDPVTSLDHERRSTIARRLVEEAKARQVIVLTHDIVFLLDLQQLAAKGPVDCVSVSMRKNGNSIGLVKPELPWVALDVKKKVAYIRNELAAVRKAEAGDPDVYRDKVKLWYMLLREAWERAVEERLFKGVVQRFNKAVQTQRLGQIEVNDVLVKDVEDGMTESSQWLHDMAVGVNPAVPRSTKLEAELKKLDEFITKVKAP